MYVSARNVFDKNILNNKPLRIPLFRQTILKLLLHCRTNTDWHV